MDLEKLPWLKDFFDSYSNRCVIEGAFFQYLPRDILLDRMKRFPLTQGLINSFLEKYVSAIFLMPVTEYDAKLWVDSSSFSFKMIINSNSSLEKKAESLIHESVHGVYRVNTTEEVEPVIEQEGIKFYNANKPFSINLFEKSIKSK